MKKHLLPVLACCMLWAACGNEPESEKNSVVSKNVDSSDAPKSTALAKVSDGPYKEYYKEGQLKLEGTVSNGQKEGEWKSYYPTGSSFSINYYAGGKLNGKTTTWYPNGQIRYIGYYTDGKPSGKWLIFNEKGEKVEEKEYQ